MALICVISSRTPTTAPIVSTNPNETFEERLERLMLAEEYLREKQYEIDIQQVALLNPLAIGAHLSRGAFDVCHLFPCAPYSLCSSSPQHHLPLLPSFRGYLLAHSIAQAQLRQVEQQLEVQKQLECLKSGQPNWQIPYEELEFLEKIGEGGFGEVFRGRWRGTVVAIKTLKGTHNMDPKEVTRFAKEVTVLRFVPAATRDVRSARCLSFSTTPRPPLLHLLCGG